MLPDNRTIRYLDRERIPYELIARDGSEALRESAIALGLDPAKVVRAVALQDRHGVVLALLPADNLLDFSALKHALARQMEPISRDRVFCLFKDCQPGTIPPFAAPYGIPSVADAAIAEWDTVYIEPGDRRYFVAMRGTDLHRLASLVPTGKISHSPALLVNDNVWNSSKVDKFLAQLRPQRSDAERIYMLRKLPAMPEMARKLLLLRNRGEPDVQVLGKVVGQDPSLSAQLVAYARSSYFGYGDRIHTLDEAISQVLGFDLAINMALGIAAGRGFELPLEGRLGLYQHWRHAVYSASLAQSLAARLPRGLRISPGMAYLAGLLHDFGMLVIGQTLKAEYFLLNHLSELRPNDPLPLLERRAIGVGHDRIGAHILRGWNMPEELVTVCANHHNESYWGEHAILLRLVQLVDRLLVPQSLSDCTVSELPESTLETLGIDEGTAREAAAEVLSASGSMDAFAATIAS